MKQVALLFFLIALVTVNVIADPPIPEGARLRDIVDSVYPEGNVLIGGTTGAWALGSNTGIIMDNEFSYVTPENDFKQFNIHPDNNTWNWTQSDQWVDHIQEWGQVLRMHSPIGPQCSNWSQEDTRTAEELEQNMREFMEEVCIRYNGMDGVVSMDVVNETVVNGSWKRNDPGTGGWEMPWFIIGRDTDVKKTPLYIRYAFEIANEFAPDMKLIFNHHEEPNNGASWNAIKTTIGYLRDLGLRVDGIGWQGHVNNGWATESHLNSLRSLIDWAHANNLEFHVTEASVWMNDGDFSEAALQKQAETYSKILSVMLEKRSTGVVAWNTWHIDDGHGWQNEMLPSLFDVNYEAKPAYYAIQNVLANPPATVVESVDYTAAVSSFALLQNYPNPFNPSTKINFQIKNKSHIELNIFDVLGHKVAELANQVYAPGLYEMEWNAVDMPSGVYFCRLTGSELDQTIKLVLAR